MIRPLLAAVIVAALGACTNPNKLLPSAFVGPQELPVYDTKTGKYKDRE